MPITTRFGSEVGKGGPESLGVTWVDIDVADPKERAWLSAWQEIGDQTRSLLSEPVRLSHRELLVDGLFLSIRTIGSGTLDDIDRLTDLKLLIGKSLVVTARSGGVAAVDELRQYLQSGRTLVTPVDLLAFMVAGMTRRMEVVIFDIVRDTDATEDQSLDSGAAPSAQVLNALRRRIFRTRRQLHSVQHVLSPIATDPALALDADDRETLVRSSNHVTRYLEILEESRSRVQMLEDQIEAERAATMTRSSLNLTIVATVFLPLSFISGLLGMNVAGIPEEHNPHAFWVVTGVSMLGAAITWMLLRRRIRDER